MRFSSLKSIFIPLALLLLPQTGFTQSEDETNAKFASDELLIETFLADESQAVKDAEDAVAAAEDAVTAANDAVTTAAADSQELLDAQQALTDAEQDLTDAQGNLEQTTLDVAEETGLITELVGKLSEEQVFAFNRSLNNSLHNVFPVELDASILQAAIDGEYDKRQINFLTKAYEEEAKFLSLAEKFEAKAEESGDDKFLEQAERMTAKAKTSKDKFLARIDHDRMDRVRPDDADLETRRAGAEDHEARHEAREAAREATHEAREVAREAVHEAREVAREIAREVREVARENARENASGRHGG